MEAVMQVRSMAETAMTTVFSSQRKAAGALGPSMPKISKRGAVRLLNSFSKLVSTHSLGTQAMSLVLLMSTPFLNAPVTIQYRGNRKARARRMRMIQEMTW